MAQAESSGESPWRALQVVADEIAVVPKGVEKEAKAVNTDLDEGIEKNLDAALIQNRMHGNVKYEVKSGVITLTGEVNSQYKRDHAEQVATRVPNVKQVVNDVQVRSQKASSSGNRSFGVEHSGRTESDRVPGCSPANESVQFSSGNSWANSREGDAMSFGLYSIGFAIVIGGLTLYAAVPERCTCLHTGLECARPCFWG